MRKLSLCLLVIALSALFGCNKKQDDGFYLRLSSPPPAMDRSTPDRLVRSGWQWASWMSSMSMDTSLAPAMLSPRAHQAFMTAMTRSNAKTAELIQKFDVIKVATETESRAVVYAWEDKDTVTYVLTKLGNEWFVDDRLTRCWNCQGKGEETDYAAMKANPYSSRIPSKTCSVCDGRGKWSQYYDRKSD